MASFKEIGRLMGRLKKFARTITHNNDRRTIRDHVEAIDREMIREFGDAYLMGEEVDVRGGSVHSSGEGGEQEAPKKESFNAAEREEPNSVGSNRGPKGRRQRRPNN